MTNKCCTKCSTILSDENWLPSRKAKGDYICRPCNNIRKRGAAIKKTFGITKIEYDTMKDAHNGKCAICHTTDPGHNSGSFVLDHDHAIGQIRGFLCNHCNTMLGMARDNPEVLYAAIQYLKSYKSGTNRPLRIGPNGS